VCPPRKRFFFSSRIDCKIVDLSLFSFLTLSFPKDQLFFPLMPLVKPQYRSNFPSRVAPSPKRIFLIWWLFFFLSDFSSTKWFFRALQPFIPLISHFLFRFRLCVFFPPTSLFPPLTGCLLTGAPPASPGPIVFTPFSSSGVARMISFPPPLSQSVLDSFVRPWCYPLPFAPQYRTLFGLPLSLFLFVSRHIVPPFFFLSLPSFARIRRCPFLYKLPVPPPELFSFCCKEPPIFLAFPCRYCRAPRLSIVPRLAFLF